MNSSMNGVRGASRRVAANHFRKTPCLVIRIGTIWLWRSRSRSTLVVRRNMFRNPNARRSRCDGFKPVLVVQSAENGFHPDAVFTPQRMALARSDCRGPRRSRNVWTEARMGATAIVAMMIDPVAYEIRASVDSTDS
jgi:hypothetical protein